MLCRCKPYHQPVKELRDVVSLPLIIATCFLNKLRKGKEENLQMGKFAGVQMCNVLMS
jgi:hypothetical protein